VRVRVAGTETERGAVLDEEQLGERALARGAEQLVTPWPFGPARLEAAPFTVHTPYQSDSN
jgi:hypothetical protein